MRIACVLSRLNTYMISLPSSTARCTVSLTFSRRSRSSGRASFDMVMRRRTSEPSRNSAMPSRYFPVSGFCSSMPSATSVTASRCTVLLATPSRLARSLMPISTCSSENALSSRTEVATDDRRPFSMSRDGVRGVGTLLFRSVGPAFRRTVEHVPIVGCPGEGCRAYGHGAEYCGDRRRAGGGVRRHRGQEEGRARRTSRSSPTRPASPTRSRRCRRPCCSARPSPRTRRSPAPAGSPSTASRSSSTPAAPRSTAPRARSSPPAARCPTTRW